MQHELTLLKLILHIRATRVNFIKVNIKYPCMKEKKGKLSYLIYQDNYELTYIYPFATAYEDKRHKMIQFYNTYIYITKQVT